MREVISSIMSDPLWATGIIREESHVVGFAYFGLLPFYLST